MNTRYTELFQTDSNDRIQLHHGKVIFEGWRKQFIECP